jgi:hypothetical protein
MVELGLEEWFPFGLLGSSGGQWGSSIGEWDLEKRAYCQLILSLEYVKWDVMGGKSRLKGCKSVSFSYGSLQGTLPHRSF